MVASSLTPTTDIARALGERKRPGQMLVVFGAEHGAEGLARKRAMLETKNADLVVFNDVGRSDIGFDAPTTRSCSSAQRASGRSRRHARKRSRRRSSTRSKGCSAHRGGRDGRGRGAAPPADHRAVAEADPADRRAPGRRHARPRARRGGLSSRSSSSRGTWPSRSRSCSSRSRTTCGSSASRRGSARPTRSPVRRRRRRTWSPPPTRSTPRAIWPVSPPRGRQATARSPSTVTPGRRSGCSGRASPGISTRCPGAPPYELAHVFRDAVDGRSAGVCYPDRAHPRPHLTR